MGTNDGGLEFVGFSKENKKLKAVGLSRRTQYDAHQEPAV